MGNRAQIGGKFIHQHYALGYGSGQVRVERPQLFFQGDQVHVECRQHLPRSVVQFASYAAALLILHLQEPGRERAEILLGFFQFSGPLFDS